MPANLLPLLAYVLISSFTPGPSNISSASLAVLRGYKQTLNYQLGLAAGVFLIMLLSGWISTTLLGLFPVLEPILRYAGAAYILYLAYAILKASYTVASQEPKRFRWTHGIALQVLNPKLIVYAFTVYATFLDRYHMNIALLGLSALLLAAVSLCATTVWALFGSVIQARLHRPRIKLAVNIALSLSLVYAAIALVAHW